MEKIYHQSKQNKKPQLTGNLSFFRSFSEPDEKLSLIKATARNNHPQITSHLRVLIDP